MRKRHAWAWSMAFALIASAALAETGAPRGERKEKRPAEEISEEVEACMSCHNDPELEIDLESEEVMLMHVDPEKFAGSVHAETGCTECHTPLRGQLNKHKALTFETKRAYRLNYSAQCHDCHKEIHDLTKESVHANLPPEKADKGPVCADCHDAHGTKKDEPRIAISKTCASCHEKVADVFAKSVHGNSLMDGTNPDVPVCADCHKSHDIADPKSAKARIGQPETCAGCHTDEKLMEKYGLSTNVMASYLQDFHGATVLLEQGRENPQALVAVCTDCHGVHDIAKADDPNSHVMKDNMAQTCAKCHEGASADFPDAWLSHYEPSWSRAPFVKAVNTGYGMLIPYMIGGLLLQVFLHLWRMLVK